MTAHTLVAPDEVRAPPPNALLSLPIIPTLTRMALPNMISMVAVALVAIAETAYVGLLGTASLAAIALVFPMVMLQQMLSAGAMGGGVSSAVSRALGAGDEMRAQALALHAVVIGLVAAFAISILFLGFGPAIYRMLGGKEAVLGEALVYSNTVFAGIAGIWLTNMLASVIRGSGNMKIPAFALLGVAGAQICLSGALGLGLGPIPRLGMIGIALGQVLAFGGGTIFLLAFLRSSHARIRLEFSPDLLRREMFRDILKVGAVSCLSPLQSVLSVLILTSLVSRFGADALAGYGIGVRLEFLLIPITFAIGVACIPLVGMAIGAGNVARARQVAWTGGTASALILGAVGLVFAIAPWLWADLFTHDPGVLASAYRYFSWVGPAYAFFGLGLCLYFSAQGAGKVLGPVLAGTARLLIIAIGGWWLSGEAPEWTIFALIAGGMIAYGLLTAISIASTRWERAPLERAAV